MTPLFWFCVAFLFFLACFSASIRCRGEGFTFLGFLGLVFSIWGMIVTGWHIIDQLGGPSF